MKYFVISDIHGSYYYFEKAMKQYDLLKCDKLLILGDMLYHGPRNDLPYGHDVKKLIQALNLRSKEIIAVKGNCEAEVDQMVLNFPINDFASVHFLNHDLYLTHGHHINPEHPIPLNKGSVVLYGHTHIYDYKVVDDVIYFNPGSISLPKNNTLHSFATIDEEGIVLYDEDGKMISTYRW